MMVCIEKFSLRNEMRACELQQQLLLHKVKVVVVALMTQPCTIVPLPAAAAAAAAQTFFSSSSSSSSFSRPAYLRPPSGSSQACRHSLATMSRGRGDPNLDATFLAKRTLRSKVKKELRNMNPTQRAQEDIAIQNIVLESSWFKSSKRLCAYISCAPLREVNTSQILSEVLSGPSKNPEIHTQNKKKLYVPRVEDKNSHMRMLNISKTDDMIANSMNILEPSPVDGDGNQREDVLQASDPVDLFILPGLAFDRAGRRLGRGGGYYDTFLRKYHELAVERQWKQPLLVALSYSVQILDKEVIPLTPNDVFVDALVSPDGLIPISPAALERL